MVVGLASYRFVNNDISFNLSQIKKAAEKVSGKVDLLCFGETFLQGFDALSWNYEVDKKIAVSQDSEQIQSVCEISKKTGVDILLGYLEKEGDKIYSSCILISGDDILHNYRRISTGWKVPENDPHYAEGDVVETFKYKGQEFVIALCGDLWVFPERFKTKGVLLWPIYVNFSLEEWQMEKMEYAQQALLAAKRTLLVSSITDNPASLGGAFFFENGEIIRELPLGEEGVLRVVI